MNNLKELKARFLPVDDIKGDIIHVSIGVDKISKEIFYLHENCLVHVDLVKGEECTLHSELQDLIRTEYMFGHNKISISTKQIIFILDCDTKLLYKREFSDEIHQAAWNNTYDYLAVLFKTGQLKTFAIIDPQSELVEHGKGELHSLVPQKQAVGWGSTTTQFQGPSTRDAEDSTVPHPTPSDNGKPVISWRGNGEEFVVSYIEEDTRVFKVFDNFCIVKCRSELPELSENVKLYGPVAWKPQGNIIAAAMFKNDKNCIALFERNGLYRMDFRLVDIFYPITLLSWSSCGRALMISQDDNEGNSHVCIYMTCNMKWFLKQHLIFRSKDSLISLNWVPTDAPCLELEAVTRKLVMQYKYKFAFDTDFKNHIIAAVNGKSIRIHGFHKSVDPSPTCTSIVELSNPVNMIAFHPSTDLFAAIDSENNIYCYKIDGIDLKCTVQYTLTKPTYPLRVNHLFWMADNPHFLIEKPEDCCSKLYQFKIESSELVNVQKFDVTEYALEHIYAVDNVVIKHNEKYRTIHRVKETPVTTLNVAYPLTVLPIKYDSEIFFLLLTVNQDIFLDNEFVCGGVTSILLKKDFLILTDTTTLYTLKLSRQTMDTLAVDGLSVFHSRPLNELAYLMCMLGDNHEIILHTPRGNLEIVICRPMQIRAIEEMLCKGDWTAAIKEIRLSRTNWNLLIDLNSKRFYENLSKVVSESSSQHTLNAIVAEVNDENCLATVYKNSIDIIPHVTPNKRKEFLEKLGDYLDNCGAFINYLSTIVRICLDQNDLKKAMKYLAFLMNSPSEREQCKAEQVIKVMKMQVEPMDLFKAALFTYDLSLAHFVAQICQIDPQEVSPILEELCELDDFEQRVAINVRYENWEMAIAYMLNRENKDKEEILEFIQVHNIAKKAYREALKIKDFEFMEDVAQLYVERLVREKRHGEAAIILIKYSFYDDAIQQFKMALDYKKCIEYIPSSHLPEECQSQLFKELAEKLVAAGKIEDAAIVYTTQLEDHVNAVKILTDGGFFTEALRIAKDNFLAKMIDIYIFPKMSKAMKRIRDTVQDFTVKFKTRLDRLMKLRNLKKHEFELLMKRKSVGGAIHADPFEFRRNRNDELEGSSRLDSDVQSVISVGSRRSSRSGTSSKSNTSLSSSTTQKRMRKMEKQKQDTSEGSKFEDIAIIRELHIMITSIYKFGPEARELMSRLMEYNMADLLVLQQYHQKLFELQVFMRDEVHNIWDEEFRSGVTVNYINENYFHMDEQFRVIPPEVENPGLSWVLDVFQQ